MGIKTNLNIAPYFDDYDIAKKYYRLLFKPGFAVQARELTQLQSTLQNQIEQFGENIYKEGSIIKGCTFTDIRNLKYIKVNDGIRPEDFVERTEVLETGVINEFYYETEDEFGLKALIVQGTSGFLSRAPDLNTFFIVYLNTVDVGGVEKKQYEPNDTIQIREYILRTQEINEETIETIIDNGIVATTSVAGFSDPVGDSFGLNVSEGIVFQRGHFLFVDDQTIVVTKYRNDNISEDEFEIQPNNVSVGYIIDETIINSQQDLSLLDNANGSPNENAPGADRLLLVPRLIARETTSAEQDSEFFILRRYENGSPIQTRDVSQFNSIAKELARRTYESHGDYTTKDFKFNVVKRQATGDFFIEMGEGVSYSKGYRISNDTKRFFRIPSVEDTDTIIGQPVNFNYGGFVRVVEINGPLPVRTFQPVDLINNSLQVIGSAIVKNIIDDRVYLFGIRLSGSNVFGDVKFIGSNVTGRVEIEPRIINSSESTLVFSFNQPFTRELSNLEIPIRKQRTTSSNGSGEIEIVPAEGEVFDLNTLKDLLVVITDGLAQKATILNSSILPNGNLFITIAQATVNVIVYHNAKQTEIQPRTKQVLDIFVKTTYSNAQSTYTLGVPDAYKLLEVKDNQGTDYTSSFKLVLNQKDDFYDHSYIEKIPGSPTPAESELTIKVGVFRIDTSTGPNVFTVDSYTNVSLMEIPNFETQDGTVLDLKSCIDFRPYRIPIAAYSTSEAGATVLTQTNVGLPDSTTQLFSSGINYLVPSINTSGTATVEYYNRRTDFIIGSSYGSFQYIVGSDVNTVRNINDRDNTIVAEIQIPGFPLLDPQEAFRLNRKRETINVLSRTPQTYTMRDIHRLAKRVDTISYYTVLSLLESSTRDLLIQGEDGLNRFKNGIIVDPFTDFAVANVGDANFSAGIDPSETTLIPRFKQFPLSLKVKNNNRTQTIGELTTLSSNRIVRFIGQQYATNFRSCTGGKYSFVGKGELTPNYDFAYDTVTTPREISVDLSRPFIDFTESLSEFVPLTRTSSNLINSNTQRESTQQVSTDATGTTTTTTTTTTNTRNFLDITRELNASAGNTTTQEIGDFITDFRFEPFIRSREIQVEMYGLRPNTRHYFFFDEVDVNASVAPGRFVEDLQAVVAGTRVVRSGEFGAQVLTNENGELFAIFRIPPNQFLVGERELKVLDVFSLENLDSASISSGKLKYNAFNFNSEKTGLTLSTRAPTFTISETSSNRTVVNRTFDTSRSFVPVPPPPPPPPPPPDPVAPPPPPPPPQPPQDPNLILQSFLASANRPDRPDCGDPLAQTFFIKEDMTKGAEALFLSSVDLYFKRKSEINGVTIQIREVENGYPTYEVLPFASKHLRVNQVNVSDDASIATTVVFDDGPIRLEAEKEYAVVIWPDADDPDYLVFTSKTGGTDLITGQPVNIDWGDGVMFTSTNNRAWKSYQDEDIKFDLYRYNFNVDSGIVEFETDDVEFFELGSVSGGSFRSGELVYAFKGSSTFSVNLNPNSNIVTGSGLTNYSQGDYFYVETSIQQKELLKIANVISSTELVLERPPTLSGTFQSQPVVAAEVVYFNPRSADSMILEKSSARENRKFQVNDVIRGIDSGADTTIIEVSNLELSYLQTMINKVTDSNSNVRVSIKAIDPSNTDDPPYEKRFEFGTNKLFNEKGCVIFSKSNDIEQEKNLKLPITLENSGGFTTSPIIDSGSARLFAYVNLISNDPDNTSRYISKRVELKEGFDSEDFRMYLTGYRPLGTDIKAYIRVKNEADPVSLQNNPWIELERISGENLFSSTSNTNDFKEFIYQIPEDFKNNGIVEYTNETGTYIGYRSFAIRIDLLAENVARVPRVLDYRGVAFE